MEKQICITIVYAVIDVNTNCVKYVSTNKEVLLEIMRNETKMHFIGELVLTERIVKFEYGG